MEIFRKVNLCYKHIDFLLDVRDNPADVQAGLDQLTAYVAAKKVEFAAAQQKYADEVKAAAAQQAAVKAAAATAVPPKATVAPAVVPSAPKA